MSGSLLTVLIPTLNRPDFIERLLAYYASCQFKERISIGDSSQQDKALANQQIIDRYKNQLLIDYVYCPQLNDSQTIQFLSNQVKTPYIVFCADDDFLVPSGLAASVNFLEKNSAYVSAHGDGLVFVLDGSGVYGRIKATSRYFLSASENETAVQRLDQLMHRYWVPLFAVHRTAVWQRMYRDISMIKDKSFTELLPCCLSIILGKHKHLPALYLLRQAHQARYFLPDTYDWIVSAQWSEVHACFNQLLTDALMEIDHLSAERASQETKKSLWRYILGALKFKFESKYQSRGSVLYKKLAYWMFNEHVLKVSIPVHPYYSELSRIRICLAQGRSQD